MRRISHLLVLLLTAGVLLAAGCGDDDDDGGGGGAAAPEATEESAGGGGGALTLTADPGGAISWDKSELSASAGTVTIKLVNESSVPAHSGEGIVCPVSCHCARFKDQPLGR